MMNMNLIVLVLIGFGELNLLGIELFKETWKFPWSQHRFLELIQISSRKINS